MSSNKDLKNKIEYPYEHLIAAYEAWVKEPTTLSTGAFNYVKQKKWEKYVCVRDGLPLDDDLSQELKAYLLNRTFNAQPI